MAKKSSTPSVAPKAAPKVISKQAVAAAPAVVATTAVRNSPIPKAVPVAKKVVSREQIAVRAFEISCGPNCGSQDDNWFRAERELLA